MHRTFGAILVSAAATVIVGCSTGAATVDASASDGGVLYRLGTGTYVVSGPPAPSDDQCNLMIKEGSTFYLTLDNVTGNASLTIGSAAPVCTAEYGCGSIADNMGTLSTVIPPATGCTMRKSIMTTITLIEDLKFTVQLIETQSERVGCTDPPGPDCTSTVTFTLVRQAPDAGTNAAD